MASPLTEYLVPFSWFLVPVLIAALSLALLLLFALQASRAARWFLFGAEARGLRRTQSRALALLRRRARERVAPTSPAPAPQAGAPGAASAPSERPSPVGFLKSRARRRLQQKAGVETQRSAAERLSALAETPAEPPLAPALPEEALRRLEVRARELLKDIPGGPRAPSAGGAERRRGAGEAIQTSRRMTDSILENLEAQARQGLISARTFEELKGRLAAKRI